MQTPKSRNEALSDLATLVIVVALVALFALAMALAVCHVVQSGTDVMHLLLPFSP